MLKLKAHGIAGRVADWISDWLDNRMQSLYKWSIIRLQDGHEWSSTGIRAGSIAVSHLQKNDLDLGLLSSRPILKFADDTKVFGKAAIPTDRLQLQL